MFGAAVALIGLFGLARVLEPDPAGLGTHQQLGFPPCGFVASLGWPCPSCGMTTAWARLVRGEIVASIDANAGGFLLGVSALPVSMWLLASGWRGAWFPVRPVPVLLIGYTAAVFVSAMVQWMTR